ncbi:uncharacterized protein LOC132051731 [Lycium ferocissimum]|uniref:uncharacterized protein LOC132051731 n=1 Tax=Lycium ferocissimum TaxID=112874 RepID=UPI002815BD8A|nr:uncharacterized protein LOC132051731 [Lycium ferocissimum]
MLFTLSLHCPDKCYQVFHVDDNCYGTLDLLEDAHNALTGGPSTWLEKTTCLEAIHPNTGVIIKLDNDADLNMLFNMYKDLGKGEVHINLTIMNEILDEAEGEIFQWTDDEEDENMIENMEAHSDDQNIDDGLSDYESDENGVFEGVSDDDEAIDHPMAKVSGKMQGEVFKYTYDEKLKKEIVLLKVGQIFNNVTHFREVMEEFVRQEGFPIEKLKNEKRRFIAICKDRGCDWKIRASP